MKVSFVFDLYEPGVAVDQGVFGFHGKRVHRAGNTVDWANDVQALAEKMKDKFNAGVPKGPFSPAVIMNRVDVYHLSTANKTLDKGSAPFELNEWNGSAQRGFPWEVALVASLYGYNPGSFTQNPRNKRGRFYLPPISTTMTDALTGVLNPADQTTTLEWLQDWLNDVQGAEIGPEFDSPEGPDYFDLGILSTQRKNAAGYEGSFTPATFVRLGRVLDVQRRRRKSQDERYQSLPIAHS